MSNQKTIQLPSKFENIFDTPARYRIWYGGRGSGKSHSVARALLILGSQQTKRILCCREYQSTIADSSHRLLSDLIKEYDLSAFYEVTKTEIRGINGTLFVFRGIKVDPQGIKSLEAIDIAWCEEAEKISAESLDMLIPTIRKPKSEIWITFNPHRAENPVYQRFVVNPPDDAIVCKVNWDDNPWFPESLVGLREYDRRTDMDRYKWIWEGQPLGLSDAQVYRGKYITDTFQANDQDKLLFGADWGFATDPTTLIRGFIRDRTLYIEHEAYAVGVDIDDTPALFRSVPDSEKWPIWADCARPETISYMQKHGFPNVKAVDKWPGSVEDGIAYMRSFERIVIHPRCKHTLQEMELYRYKTDKTTGEVLPIIVDKDNHIMDSCRYALNHYIRKKTAFLL